MAYKGYVPAIEHESLDEEAKNALAAYACHDFRNASWVKEEKDETEHSGQDRKTHRG